MNAIFIVAMSLRVIRKQKLKNRIEKYEVAINRLYK